MSFGMRGRAKTMRRGRVPRLLAGGGALSLGLSGLVGLVGVATAPPAAAQGGSQSLYVTNGGNASLTVYAPGTTGDNFESKIFSGPSSGLHVPTGVAFAPSGNLFVANFATNSITEYDPNGSGVPIATISGSNTGFGSGNGLEGIAIGSGKLFVVDANASATGIYEFNLSQITPGTDNLAPVATIAGPATGLNSPYGIALDPVGDIFVSLLDNTVAEFAPDAHGDVAPLATISGSATKLDQPGGLAIGFGTLYVANADDVITEYPLASIAPGPNDLAPGVTISGLDTGLANPAGIGLDASGDLFVANLTTPASVTEYGPGAAGNAAPIADISGSLTGLSGPNFVALGPPVAPSATLAVTTPATLPGVTVGTYYAKGLSASGGVAPYTWSISSGTLPAGLSLDAKTGVISGTPSAAATSNFTVKVTDSASSPASATEAVSLTVSPPPGPLAITTTSLAGATAGTYYYQALSASGGVLPYNWSITSGTLPAGLSLDPATGVISGTPTAAGSSSLTFKLTDSASPPATVSTTLVLNVAPAPPGHPTGVIYVTLYSTNSVVEYPVGASGNVAPVRTIELPTSTAGPASPGGVVVGPNGDLYVFESVYFGHGTYNPVDTVGSILVYAPGASGAAQPIRTISGIDTRLGGGVGMAFDAAGDLYVANNHGPYPNSILEFPPGANGDVPPIRDITGPDTGLGYPAGLQLDVKGDIYVANFAQHDIVEFLAGADGDAIPTVLIHTVGVAKIFSMNAAGDIFEGRNPDQIVEYAPTGPGGQYVQVADIAGPATQLNGSGGPILGPGGNIFIWNTGGLGSVNEFAAGANGDVPPIALITGPSTGLGNPATGQSYFPQDLAIGPPLADTTTVSSSANPSVAGQSVTLTATVAPANAGAGTPTGTVTFSEGSTILGTEALSVHAGLDQASLTTSSLPAGNHLITASYSGGPGFAASSGTIHQVVNRVPTTLTAGPVLGPGHPAFILTAQLMAAGAPLGGQSMVFRAGTTVVCRSVTNASGMATCNARRNPAGLRAVVAHRGYTASFAGTAVYAPSQANGVFYLRPQRGSASGGSTVTGGASSTGSVSWHRGTWSR